MSAWKLIRDEAIGVSLLVPAMLNFMIQVPREQFTFDHLRWIQSGASPLPVSLIEQYSKLGIEIHQIYGLTETCGPACVISAENALQKIGSTGKAFFHTEVRVVDDAGADCDPGLQGEVWVKGGHIMLEYWHRPEATADTITQDGWLRTGDVASIDEEGFVYIQDRIKDMIISGGENVYPAEIENVILSHPDVIEVAVIGQPKECQWQSAQTRAPGILSRASTAVDGPSKMQCIRPIWSRITAHLAHGELCGLKHLLKKGVNRLNTDRMVHYV